jgi:hypothetical protein
MDDLSSNKIVNTPTNIEKMNGIKLDVISLYQTLNFL